MPSKCSAFGCRSGYDAVSERVSCFKFPFEKSELLADWVRFVGRKDWTPTKNDSLCIKHFRDEFIKSGQRTTLKWELSPIPTIHSSAALKRPSALYTPDVDKRKTPKVRNVLQDEMGSFRKIDTITSLDDLSESLLPNFPSKRDFLQSKKLSKLMIRFMCSSGTEAIPCHYHPGLPRVGMPNWRRLVLSKTSLRTSVAQRKTHTHSWMNCLSGGTTSLRGALLSQQTWSVLPYCWATLRRRHIVCSWMSFLSHQSRIWKE